MQITFDPRPQFKRKRHQTAENQHHMEFYHFLSARIPPPQDFDQKFGYYTKFIKVGRSLEALIRVAAGNMLAIAVQKDLDDNGRPLVFDSTK